MFFTVGCQQLGGAFPLPALPFGVQRYNEKTMCYGKSATTRRFAAKAVQERVKSGVNKGKNPFLGKKSGKMFAESEKSSTFAPLFGKTESFDAVKQLRLKAVSDGRMNKQTVLFNHLQPCI